MIPISVDLPVLLQNDGDDVYQANSAWIGVPYTHQPKSAPTGPLSLTLNHRGWQHNDIGFGQLKRCVTALLHHAVRSSVKSKIPGVLYSRSDRVICCHGCTASQIGCQCRC